MVLCTKCWCCCCLTKDQSVRVCTYLFIVSRQVIYIYKNKIKLKKSFFINLLIYNLQTIK